MAATTGGGTGVGPGVKRWRFAGTSERRVAGPYHAAVEALLAFAAALLAFRFAGDLARRFRVRRRPELAAWSASLLAYALASGALAWGAAAGWNEAAFRVYYACGGLLTAALLGVGSLLLIGRRWAGPPRVVSTRLAVGVFLSEPLTEPVGGATIPEAQAHLDLLPARVLAIVGNGAGTLAVVAVALATFRRRPLANGLIVAGTVVAAAGSALAGLGAARTAAFVAVAVALLYAGFRAATAAPGEPARLSWRPAPVGIRSGARSRG
jgi:hypothetical protein